MRPEDYVLNPALALYLPLWMSPDTPTDRAFASRDAYGHTVTVTGAVRGLQGYTFDGTDDDLSGGTGILNPGTSDFTIEVVFYRITGGAEGREVVSKIAGSGSGGAAGYGIQLVHNRWLIQNAANACSYITDSSGVLNDTDKWIHCIVDRQDTTITLMVNGILSTDSIILSGGGYGAGLNITNTRNFYIGRTVGPLYAAWFKGTIAEVIFYLKVLSFPEKVNHYLAAKRRMPFL